MRTFDRLNNVLVAVATSLLGHRMVARLDLQWLVKSPGSKCERMPGAVGSLYCVLRDQRCWRVTIVAGRGGEGGRFFPPLVTRTPDRPNCARRGSRAEITEPP